MPLSAVEEHQALEILLMQVAEESTEGSALLSAADRQRAERAAGALDNDALENQKHNGITWIAARAHALTHALQLKQSAFKRIDRWVGWPHRLTLLVLAAGLLAGISANLTDTGTTINLLAPPVWVILLWNLGVLLARLLPAGQATLSRGLVRLGSAINAKIDRFATAGPQGDEALITLQRLALRWPQASADLQSARVNTILHLAAAASALAVIAGMYLRGLVLGYEVDWSSTFLDGDSVHAVLSTLMIPASIATGIELPSASVLTAIGDNTATSAQRSAAPWIHLWSMTLALFVVLPRGILAIRGWVASRSMARAVPVDLSAPYFLRLQRVHRARNEHILVMPAYADPDDDARQRLRDLIARAAPDAASVELTAVANEDSEPGYDGDPTQYLLIVLIPAGITPETEVHGEWLARLASAEHAGMVVLIDEQDFVRRFGESSQRVESRRSGWQALAESRDLSISTINLAHAAEDQAERIADAIDAELAR